MRQLAGSLRGTEQLGDAANDRCVKRATTRRIAIYSAVIRKLIQRSSATPPYMELSSNSMHYNYYNAVGDNSSQN